MPYSLEAALFFIVSAYCKVSQAKVEIILTVPTVIPHMHPWTVQHVDIAF